MKPSSSEKELASQLLSIGLYGSQRWLHLCLTLGVTEPQKGCDQKNWKSNYFFSFKLLLLFFNWDIVALQFCWFLFTK